MEALLTAHPALWAVVLCVTGAVRLGGAWLAHRTAVCREREHTRRVELATHRTRGADRAAVVGAAAQLAPVRGKQGSRD